MPVVADFKPVIKQERPMFLPDVEAMDVETEEAVESEETVEKGGEEQPGEGHVGHDKEDGGLHEFEAPEPSVQEEVIATGGDFVGAADVCVELAVEQSLLCKFVQSGFESASFHDDIICY